MKERKTDPLQLVLFNLAAPVFVIDREGNPYYANKAAVELLGKGIDPTANPDSLAAVYQAKLADTDEAYPTQRMPIVRALSGETSSVDDMVIDRPDGKIRIHVEGFPIFGISGRVEYAAACFRDITRERQLEQHMHTDRLTGALNRHALERDLPDAVRRLERTKRRLGVVFLDVNRFKPINDEYGHHIGDQVLYEFTRRLKRACRKTEQPYRYGGDEFVVVCENLEDERTIHEIRSRIEREVGGTYSLGSVRLEISAAVGASSTRSPQTSPARLLMEADARMYADKNGENELRDSVEAG